MFSRLQEVTSVVGFFMRSDLDRLFDELFVNKIEYENFIKKYFKKISKFISKSMYSKYHKLHPSHVQSGLLKLNEIRKDTYEIKVYKLIKTWA